MKTATIREAQHHLAKLMAEVEKGEEIILTRRGEAVGKLIPMGKPKGAMGKVDWHAALKRRDDVVGNLPLLGYNAVLEERESQDR